MDNSQIQESLIELHQKIDQMQRDLKIIKNDIDVVNKNVVQGIRLIESDVSSIKTILLKS